MTAVLAAAARSTTQILDLIDRARALHAATNWPLESDHHAL